MTRGSKLNLWISCSHFCSSLTFCLEFMHDNWSVDVGGDSFISIQLKTVFE